MSVVDTTTVAAGDLLAPDGRPVGVSPAGVSPASSCATVSRQYHLRVHTQRSAENPQQVTALLKQLSSRQQSIYIPISNLNSLVNRGNSPFDPIEVRARCLSR